MYAASWRIRSLPICHSFPCLHVNFLLFLHWHNNTLLTIKRDYSFFFKIPRAFSSKSLFWRSIKTFIFSVFPLVLHFKVSYFVWVNFICFCNIFNSYNLGHIISGLFAISAWFHTTSKTGGSFCIYNS